MYVNNIEKCVNEIDLEEYIKDQVGPPNMYEGNQPSWICPFHKEVTPSFKIYIGDDNVKRFKCFGCGRQGNIIDFVKEYNNFNNIGDALKKLGYQTITALGEDLNRRANWICNEINKELESNKSDDFYKLDRIHIYRNEYGTPVYGKMIFKNSIKKQIKQFTIEDKKFKEWRRPSQDTLYPYNLSNILKAKSNREWIYITEGEKDAETLINRYNVAATTIKDFDLENLKIQCEKYFQDSKIVLFRDSGQVGLSFFNECIKILKPITEALKIPYKILYQIDELGDNKDITDLVLSTNMDRVKFREYINCALDLNDINELQQDGSGVYLWKKPRDLSDRSVEYYKEYITNFTIEKCRRFEKVLDKEEVITLLLKANNERIIERYSNVNCFYNTEQFNKFLSSSELTYHGTKKELLKLKDWIIKYFATEANKIFEISGIHKIDDNWLMIESEGTIDKNSQVSKSMFCEKGSIYTNFIEVDTITQDELQLIMDDLLNFNEEYIVVNVLAMIGICFMNSRLANLKYKAPLTGLIGLHGSGKNDTITHILAPILCMNKKDSRPNFWLEVLQATEFSIQRFISNSNFIPCVLDEYKPEKKYEAKYIWLESLLKQIYNRGGSHKGTKEFEVIEFNYSCTCIIMGERYYKNRDAALMERSNLIEYKAQYIRNNEERVNAFYSLKKNKRILNKLGKSLLLQALNFEDDKVNEFIDQRMCEVPQYVSERVKNNYSALCLGIELFNIVIKKGSNVDIDIKAYRRIILDNILNCIYDDNESITNSYDTYLIIILELAQTNEEVLKCQDLKNGEWRIWISKVWGFVVDSINKNHYTADVMDRTEFMKGIENLAYIKRKGQSRRTKKCQLWTKEKKECIILDVNKLDHLKEQLSILEETLKEKKMNIVTDSFDEYSQK